MNNYQPLNLANQLALINEHWQPVIIDWHDFQFRLVKFQGEFGWHIHETDKVLLVAEGTMYIDFKEQTSVKIEKGELYVIPKDISHQPRSDSECAILLIEPLV